MENSGNITAVEKEAVKQLKETFTILQNVGDEQILEKFRTELDLFIAGVNYGRKSVEDSLAVARRIAIKKNKRIEN